MEFKIVTNSVNSNKINELNKNKHCVPERQIFEINATASMGGMPNKIELLNLHI